MDCCACHTALPAGAVYCHACGAKQPDAVERLEYEYAAFISYRHLPRDQKVAIEVQKAIEAFRFPEGALPQAGPHGSVHESSEHDVAAQRITRCFRDEDELAAAHSLPERITDALARSRTLVVVCTPDTPQSEWVNREIEAFAHLHGRTRIFTVLAGGSSAESIPTLLTTRIVVDESGGVRSVAESPLAADLRPDSAARPALEKLRIVAAVMGCDFDSLRQRDRKRKRKRMAIGAACIVAAVALVAALSTIAMQNARSSLESESLRLAGEAQQLLDQGDRYGAIETALSALPASSNDASRPLVPEAQTVLENALEVSPRTDSIWRASYSIQTEHPMSLLDDTTAHPSGQETAHASAIAVSNAGSFFALSDDDGTITTYDIATGRRLAQCDMPDDAGAIGEGLYVRTLAAAGDYLIVSNAGTPGAVACFEGRTGTMTWSYSGVTFPAIDTSFNPSYASMAQANADGGLSAVVAEAETGKLIAPGDFMKDTHLPASSGACAIAGRSIGDLYAAFGNTLVYANLGTGEAKAAVLAYPIATSIGYDDEGTLVVATVDEMPENGVVRDYAIEAFDDALNPLWSYRGSLTSEMLDDGNYITLLAAEPTIHGFTLNKAGVAVTAGRDALVLDVKSGKETFKRTYDQTVISMQPASDEQTGYDKTFIACSNGIITQKDLSGEAQDREGDSERLVLPFPIRWAHIVAQDDIMTAIVIPANANDRIVAFHANLGTSDTPTQEPSLDELIAQANDVLTQGGRR